VDPHPRQCAFAGVILKSYAKRLLQVECKSYVPARRNDETAQRRRGPAQLSVCRAPAVPDPRATPHSTSKSAVRVLLELPTESTARKSTR
jgi:hypothetical protein